MEKLIHARLPQKFRNQMGMLETFSDHDRILPSKFFKYLKFWAKSPLER